MTQPRIANFFPRVNQKDFRNEMGHFPVGWIKGYVLGAKNDVSPLVPLSEVNLHFDCLVMKTKLIQISWHLQEPVFSVDFDNTGRLVTCGGDTVARVRIYL
jgi:hypothetical protein